MDAIAHRTFKGVNESPNGYDEAKALMVTPPAPPHDELTDRRFSFYPPILGIEHNEWVLQQATWAEMLVRNTKSDLEVAIPRKYFGNVSLVDEPVMIVGLNKELQYQTGAVWPTERKVLSMPTPASASRPVIRMPGEAMEPRGPSGFSAMVGSSGNTTESRMTKLIAYTFGSVLLVGLLVWALVKFTPDAKPTYLGKDQSYLELTRDDDYFAIVRRLGPPKGDRWRADTGELQFRALEFPERGYIVVLMGNDRDSGRYLGTVAPSKDGKQWSALHAAETARGTNTLPLLRSLKPF